MSNQEHSEDVYKILKDTGYSDKAIKYFQTDENTGIIEDADQITNLTGPCGDAMKISLNIESDKISDAKIQVLGCPGAVASGCAVVNLAKGKTIQEASQIDLDLLYAELEKLPEKKVHCARLAIKILQKALDEYSKKQQELLQ